MRGYAKSRLARVDEEAGEREQIKYLFLNTRLPLYKIAKIVGVSAHRVNTVCYDDMEFLKTTATREETIILESQIVKDELVYKLKKLRH